MENNRRTGKTTKLADSLIDAYFRLERGQGLVVADNEQGGKIRNANRYLLEILERRLSNEHTRFKYGVREVGTYFVLYSLGFKANYERDKHEDWAMMNGTVFITPEVKAFAHEDIKRGKSDLGEKKENSRPTEPDEEKAPKISMPEMYQLAILNEERNSQFKKELEQLLNKYSMENGSDTPDFLLAEYMLNSLRNFKIITRARSDWSGTVQVVANTPNVRFVSKDDLNEGIK